MNPRSNPYSPGAGTPPPQLAGRDEVLDAAYIALDRVRAGRSAKSLLMVGLRGVGKTVLLNAIHIHAEQQGFLTILLEAPESRSLPALIVPPLRVALLKLDRMSVAKDLAKRALRGLGGFVQSMKLKYDDLEFSVDLGLEEGVADSGDLDSDLSALLQVVGDAAKSEGTALVLLIDELQYVAEYELGALIMALHRCAQRQLPVTLVGAGLPQLIGQTGKAKSYAERLFSFPEVGPLERDAAASALVEPARKQGVEFTNEALDAIIEKSQAYPYFIQEWGKHSWNTAPQSPVAQADVELATEETIAELDAGFFRVRFDRLTPSEKRYLRAMAELGPGPHRSGEIARVLDKPVRSVAPTRATLIDKGMIYSPSHGDTAFTVPLFDGFMKRVMPTLI